MSFDGVEDDEELSGDCDEGDFWGFSGFDHGLIGGLEAGAGSSSSESGHVESVAHALSSTADMARASELSGVTVEGGKAGQSGDGFARSGAEFGHESQEGGGGDWADAGDRAQALVGLLDLLIGVDEGGDAGVIAVDLGIEPGDMTGQVVALLP